MNVVIIEDERPAAERLKSALASYDPEIRVVAHLQTVKDTVRWLRSHAEPDLLFVDVQLSDGLSLEAFRTVQVSCPVVFTTAYDAYVLDAFECNSIDYLLKPIKPERLSQAFQKYNQLRRHFAGDVVESVRSALQTPRTPYKERLVVQRGHSYVALDAARIRYARSEERTTFLVDADGTRYLCDEALTSLEDLLDPADFFRLNRQYLARVEGVASFRAASGGRIEVSLVPEAGETVLVSQEKAARFRDWMDR